MKDQLWRIKFDGQYFIVDTYPVVTLGFACETYEQAIDVLKTFINDL